jgi:hypothetical protein
MVRCAQLAEKVVIPAVASAKPVEHLYRCHMVRLRGRPSRSMRGYLRWAAGGRTGGLHDDCPARGPALCAAL